MKILLPTLALLILFNLQSFSQVTWTAPVQIDDNAGTFPNIEFDKSGKMYVTYYDIQRDSVMVRSETIPKGAMGTEKRITNAGTNTGLHFGGTDTIDVVVAKFLSHVIFQSTNGGGSYTQIKTIANTNNASSLNQMHGFFAEEGNQLRLLYPYVNYNAVVGDKPQMYQIMRTANTWDVSGTFIADGAPRGLFENQQKLLAIGTRGTFYSSDDGGSFTELNPGGAFADQLKASGSDSWGGKLYMVREYTGLSGNLVFTYSSDDGATWASPQKLIDTSWSINYPKIAVKGDTIVTAWLEQPTPQAGINGYMALLASYSLNGGNTFSTPDTLFKGTNFKVISSSFDDNRADFDIANSGDRFAVVYSAVLNNLSTNQHTYVREITFPPLASVSRSNTLQGIKIYSNHPEGGVTVDIGQTATLLKARVLNLTGNVVMAKEFSNTDKIELDIQAPPGIYLIEISDQDNNSAVFKMVMR